MEKPFFLFKTLYFFIHFFYNFASFKKAYLL